MPRACTTSELDIDLTRSERSREAMLADIRARLSVLPASILVGQPIAHRLDHMLSGVRAQIALKIYGDDYDTLAQPCRRSMERRLAPIPGIVDLQTEKQVRIPQLQVRVDYDKAKRYGLTPSAHHRVAGDALERARRLPDHRPVQALRRRAAAERRRPAHRRTGPRCSSSRRPGAFRLSSVAEVVETRRPEPDPARERPPPYRRARQHRWLRHGAHCRGDPAPRSPSPTARKAISRSSKASSRRRKRPRAASAAVAGLARADLHRALLALPLRGRWRSSSWAMCRLR